MVGTVGQLLITDLLRAEKTGRVVRSSVEKRTGTLLTELIQTDKHLSGYLTERMLHASMVASAQYFVMPYEFGRDVTSFNGLTADRGVDVAGLDLGSHVPVAEQVKNIREWVYPDRDIVWTLLASAAQLNAVPVIMARRIAEPTFPFMNDIGGYALPLMKNYISREIEDDGRSNAFLNAAATLGYRDVELIDGSVPIPRFVEFFARRLPARVQAMAETFLPLRDGVLDVAVNDGLWDDIRAGRGSGVPRGEVFHDFWRKVRQAGEVEE